LNRLKNSSSIELFSEHSISYSHPENFNPGDKSLFYDENFSFDIPAVRLFELSQAKVSNCSVVENFLPVYWLTHHKKQAVLAFCKELVRSAVQKKENVEFGILGVQDWANNYFHWMTELLPRIAAMHQHHPDFPVLIPANYLNYPFIVESLQQLNIDFKPFDVKHTLKVNTLKAVEVPHVGRFNEGLMYFFRDKFMKGFAPVSHPFRLVYISRSRAKRRRISNEDEVFALLKLKGFQKVNLEELKLMDQVKLFQEARIVVGCHGAGLANIMFMQKNQTVIELKSNNNNYWCYFSLARVFGLKYFYSLNNGHEANHRDADIDIDLDALNQLLTKAMNN
jgi:capsular polysaccharide biosynthesis protein